MTTNTTRFVTASIALILMTVCFGFNSSVLDDRTRESLDKVVSQLDSLSDYSIRLSGHTDNIGSNEYNDKLSKERAMAVRNYLISKQVDSTKITLEVYGEEMPTVPNITEENRALNRRVEVTVNGEKAEPVVQIVSPKQPEQPETIAPQKEKPAITLLVKKEVKKKKVRRRLVWTGWRTGFHWSTSGR